MKNRQLWRFLVVAFLLAIPPQLLAIRGGMKGPAQAWLVVTMWAPALAALLSSGASRARAVAALRRSGWRMWGAALLVGWSFTFAETGWLAVLGAGRWNAAHFELRPDGTGVQAIHKLATVLGNGPQGFGLFALNLLLSVTLAAGMVAVIGGVGEELGWRAVLQPELERRFGPLEGTVLTGLLWGWWHLPVNLSGYNDAEHPALTALVLFQVGTIGFSFAFAWLVRRSGGSVWPAALAHGANNALANAFLLTGDGWGPSTAASLLSSLLVGGFFAWRLSREAGAARPVVPGAVDAPAA